MKHETGEGEVMEASQGLGEALVVSGQTAETCSPRMAALDPPTTREQDKAALSLSVFDHLQLNAVLLCGLRSAFARIALIHIRQLHALAGDLGQEGCGGCAGIG